MTESPFRKGAIVGLILVGLVGVLIAGITTSHHYKIAAAGFEEKSFCSLSEFVDCDVAIASPYSKVFGIPTSELGLLFFLFVTLASLYALISEKATRTTLSFIFCSALVALAYAAYMAYIAFFKLHVLCLLCTGLYLAIILLVILSLMALRLRPVKIFSFIGHYLQDTFKKGADGSSRLGGHLLAFGLLFGIGLLFFVGLNRPLHGRTRPFNKEGFVRAYLATPKQEVKLPEGRPFWGDPDAKVTIVTFSDFECPFCRRAAFSLKPFLGEYRRQVRFLYLHYPLDMACNPNMERPLHQYSCLAAKATFCAHQKGRFWEYHDLVFENQRRLSHALLSRLADKVGLSEDEFNRCLASDEVAKQLQEDIAAGNQLDIHGTPAIYVNGHLLKDWTSPEKLQAVIEAELKNQN
ncbi:MAG: thioredoxin domain-containing protein [Deltaproteobacteria bacterium]|nr:thioredoxin domain-containing protein [Deltaproteobacteria bacterium]